MRLREMVYAIGRKLWVLFLLSHISLPQICPGQTKELDSLKLALQSATHDSTRCTILGRLAETVPDTERLAFNEKLKTLALKNLAEGSDPRLRKIFKYHLYSSFYNTAFTAFNKGDVATALEYFRKGLKLCEEIQDKRETALVLNNIGSIYNYTGEIASALEFLHRGLKIREEIKDSAGIAQSLNNIGFIYNNQGDFDKALEYYKKSLALKEKIKDKAGIANSLNNLGLLYTRKGDILNAIDCHKKSLKIEEEIGDRSGIALSLNNIGTIFYKQGDVDQAIDYYGKSLRIQEEIQDKQGIVITLHNMGGACSKQKNYKAALSYALKSMEISKALGYPESIRNAARLLSEIYEELAAVPGASGKEYGMKALSMHKLYIQMRDSINNRATQTAAAKKHFQYVYGKKAAADSVAFAKSHEIKNAEIEKQNAELKAKRYQQFFLFGGLGLVGIFAIFMYNRFRITQKQKRVIEKQKVIVEKQKKVVEEKQKEILDSIHYAKRIQRALMTNETYFDRALGKLQRK